MDDYGFKDLPDIYFVRQKEQKGLTDAIKYAEKFTGDEDFVVLLGDTIYRSNDERTITSHLIDEYSRNGAPIVAVEKVPPEKVTDYGIIEPATHHNSLFKIKGVVEKPEISYAPSDLGITGIYAFQSEIYGYISVLSPGKNNELQLSDVINSMAKEQDIFGYVINGKRYDIGTKEMWYRTFLEFSKQLQENE